MFKNINENNRPFYSTLLIFRANTNNAVNNNINIKKINSTIYIS